MATMKIRSAHTVMLSTSVAEQYNYIMLTYKHSNPLITSTLIQFVNVFV